ncbi:hypothetical protein PYCCODRAFT_885062 [Trametes coccinea BRFM310]|uniref:Uncharacterized protein n=1 Tax=Trametes coccinea (strain BRFM310) TaxID=1353009 RepID=A0A1Y2IEG7_TRAC3|nr:hypothetical protein PYCCODRAFT_885062 [Trametes coccinea BRFM310]
MYAVCFLRVVRILSHVGDAQRVSDAMQIHFRSVSAPTAPSRRSCKSDTAQYFEVIARWNFCSHCIARNTRPVPRLLCSLFGHAAPQVQQMNNLGCRLQSQQTSMFTQRCNRRCVSHYDATDIENRMIGAKRGRAATGDRERCANIQHLATEVAGF